MNQQQEKLITIIFCGDTNVGKTALISRFKNNFFCNYPPTVGIDINMVDIIINQKRVKLKLVDIPGSMSLQNLPTSMFRNVQGVIYVYDISEFNSFESIENWKMRVQEVIDYERTPCLLIGNKQDLRQDNSVPFSNAQEYALDNNFQFFETSALNNNQVHNSIKSLAIKIYSQQNYENQQNPQLINLGGKLKKQNDQPSKSCCKSS